jgi:hypothetical protein
MLLFGIENYHKSLTCDCCIIDSTEPAIPLRLVSRTVSGHGSGRARQSDGAGWSAEAIKPRPLMRRKPMTPGRGASVPRWKTYAKFTTNRLQYGA